MRRFIEARLKGDDQTIRFWFPETDPFTTTPDLQLSKLPPQARLNRNAREYEAHLRMRGFVILRTSYRQLDPNE